MSIMKKLIFLGFYLSASGCTLVQPWERGNLSKIQMSPQYNESELMVFQHNYTSREAGSFNNNGHGGGCGCN